MYALNTKLLSGWFLYSFFIGNSYLAFIYILFSLTVTLRWCGNPKIKKLSLFRTEDHTLKCMHVTDWLSHDGSWRCVVVSQLFIHIPQKLGKKFNRVFTLLFVDASIKFLADKKCVSESYFRCSCYYVGFLQNCFEAILAQLASLSILSLFCNRLARS